MAIPGTDAAPAIPQHRARITNRPVRLGLNPRAKLAKNLRNLHEFWEEYMFGIGDNKAAKDFTRKFTEFGIRPTEVPPAPGCQ